jgi:hypothetical protein
MTGDPARWLDDESAPAELRRDLGRAASLGSAGYSAEAGLARLEATLAAGAIVQAKTAGGLAKLWWMIGGGGAALVAGLVAWGVRSTPARPAAAPVLAVQVVAAPPSAVAAPRDETGTDTAPAVSTATATPTPMTTPTTPAITPAIPPAPTPTASRPDADAVRAELTQLGHIRSLVSSDPSTALAGAQEGDRTFPHGLLHQEREVVAVDALVALGRMDDASKRARSLLRVYPTGPYAEHLRAVAAGVR